MLKDIYSKILQISFILKTGIVITECSHSLISLHDNTEQGSLKNTLWNATSTDLLKRDLFLHYDKFSRPSYHKNITTVNIDFQFKHIELDDTKFIMTVTGWLKMKWKDEKLKWNESNYDGINKLQVADHEIWQPDIVIYGSALGNSIDHYANIHLLVWSSGDVLWVPPCHFQVFCEMDLTKWPYDSHSCNLSFTSWMHGGDGINLTVTERTTLDDNPNHGAFGWNVTLVKAYQIIKYYKCCDEPYYTVVYTIGLERAYSPYTTIIFTPIIGVALICLAIFWFPINSCVRFYLGGIIAVIQTVFLVYLLERLVMFGNSTPLIVSFFAYSLILNGMSMAGCLLCYNLAAKHRSTRVPWAVKKFTNSRIFNLILFHKYQSFPINHRDGRELAETSRLDEHHENPTYIENQINRPVSGNWTIVAVALDRLMFYLYLVFYIGFTSKCLL